MAESMSNIRVEDREGAFRPIARLLGVTESEMAFQFQVVAGNVTRPRYAHSVNRIYMHALGCAVQARLCVHAHDFF